MSSICWGEGRGEGRGRERGGVRGGGGREREREREGEKEGGTFFFCGRKSMYASPMKSSLANLSQS